MGLKVERARLRLGLVAVAAVAAAGVFGALDHSAGAAAARDRAVADMPDDISGPQVHVLYVVASDGVDGQLDTNGVISASVASWQAWLRGQTGGRGLRLDTHRGELDITFLRFAGVYEGRRSVEVMRAAGFNDPTKTYAVYWDGGAHWTCGAGSDSPPFGVVILRGTPPGGLQCASIPLGRNPPGIHEFGMLHEVMHALGYVPSCAPHYTPTGGPHVSDSRFDLMYTGDQPWGVGDWRRMGLDVGRDDYFMANVPGCPDLSNSPYLESAYSISVTVSGSGTVTSSPAGIVCPGSCTGKFGGSVTLTATPSAGALFESWTGACTGTATCVVTGEASATASFVNASHRRSLTLRIRGWRAIGELRVSDGYEACGRRAVVIVERRHKQRWSIVRRVRTDRAGAFTVSIPRGSATYRARAPEGTAGSHNCITAVSRTVASSA